MSIKPYPILVRRVGVWTEVQTDELLPGDLVSIGKSSLSYPASLTDSRRCSTNQGRLWSPLRSLAAAWILHRQRSDALRRIDAAAQGIGGVASSW